MLLKIFEQVASNVGLEDWFYEAPVTMILRDTNEEDLSRILDTVYNYWQHTQVKIPDADLPPVDELKILPITHPVGTEYDEKEYTGGIAAVREAEEVGARKGFPYSILDPLQQRMYDEHVEFIGKQPALYVTEIIANDFEYHKLPVDEYNRFKASFVRITTLNDIEREDVVTYFKTSGRYAGISSEQDTNFIINCVSPLEMYVSKPDTVGVRLNKLEWSVLYITQAAYNPPFVVKWPRHRFLFGQKSFLGPKYYLVDTWDWLDEPISTQRAETHLDAEKKVIETKFEVFSVDSEGNMITPDIFGLFKFGRIG